MPITVIVRSAAGDGASPGRTEHGRNPVGASPALPERGRNLGENRLTFDGMQPIVIGRGPSCDVRLPDRSVSHRHASLRAQGADFVLVDEGSMNGTFVGGARVAARTSRIVRSGDLVRAGRVWLELRLDRSPITRDVAAATRDLALALVSEALARSGTDSTTRVEVVEGRDQGARLALVEENRPYVLGRAAECDFPLADADVSREHVQVIRREGLVVVRDLGAKNGTWLADNRLPARGEAAWRPAQMIRVGRTVLALVEPLDDALAQIESDPDEALAPDDPIAPPPSATPAPGDRAASEPSGAGRDPAAAAVPAVDKGPEGPAPRPVRPRPVWSATDLVVVSAAVAVLALSIAGLVWLLRG